jgi:hypothetical protein
MPCALDAPDRIGTAARCYTARATVMPWSEPDGRPGTAQGIAGGTGTHDPGIMRAMTSPTLADFRLHS